MTPRVLQLKGKLPQNITVAYYVPPLRQLGSAKSNLQVSLGFHCVYTTYKLSLSLHMYIYIYLILILHVVYLTESIAIVSPRKGVQHGNRQRPIPLEDVGIAGSGGCFA